MGVIAKLSKKIEAWNEADRKPAKRSRGSSQPDAKALFPGLGGFIKDDDDDDDKKSSKKKTRDGSEYLGSGGAKRAADALKGAEKKRQDYMEDVETGRKKTSSRRHPSGSKNRY